MKHLKTMLVIGGVLVVGGALAYFLLRRPREVFNVSRAGGSTVDPKEAKAIAELFGGRLATKSELAAAQKAGAAWCRSGWVAEDDGTIKDSQYPMQETPIDPATSKPMGGCGYANVVNTCVPPTCEVGVTVYGPKPKKPDEIKDFVVLPWSAKSWSQSS